MVEAGAAEDDEEEEGEVVHLANGAHDENNNRNTINDGEDDDENDVVKVSNGDKDEKEHGEGRYFGSLAKEGKAPPGTNPFATKTFANDTKEDIKKMIEDAKRQTETQRKEREKIEFEEREKERLAAENRGLKYVPRAKAGEGEEGGKGGDVVRRKVVRAKRPGGMSKNDGKEDGNEAKTPNAFASLVSGGVKKAVDESKKEESPQKGSVFSRLSKKGGGEEDKSLTTTKKKASSPSPETANKLTRQQQQQQQQQQHQKSENKDQPSLALFPGLANFKDDENKKPPPKGGAGVFSGFAGFAPKPSTSKQQHRRGGGEPSSSILEEEDENSKPSSSKPLSSFKPSAFAKELGLESVPKELDAVKCANASEFAKEILGL